ncbi:reverse transcriptase domain-containing protein, partial [Tanacetum coccineum]
SSLFLLSSFLVVGFVIIKSIIPNNWFDSLDPKSVDGFEELSSKFLEEFSQQKRYDKDPTEIYDIKRKPNEGLQAFMYHFKAVSAHIKGV